MSEQTLRDGIAGIVEDAMRFGAALGSWGKSTVPYQRDAARRAFEAAQEVFQSEALDIIAKAISDGSAESLKARQS